MQLCQSCEMLLGQADLPGNNPLDRTLDTLPSEWQKEYRQFSKIILALSARYGSEIVIKLYDPRSLQGMLKAIRWKLRHYPAFVIEGKEIVFGANLPALETSISFWQAHLETLASS